MLDGISNWQRREEILWCQRARVDFLCFGDKNSNRLHKKSSIRKAINTITGLKATDGVIHMNMLEMEDTVISYFGSLFASSSLSSPDVVLSLIST